MLTVHVVSLVSIALRALAFLSGLFLLYCALFLYENEQGRIQSTLEDWWIRVDDKRHLWVSRHTAFMREIAGLTESTFKSIFGERIIALRAIWVSVCYSLASIGLAFLIVFIIAVLQYGHREGYLPRMFLAYENYVILIAWIIGFILLGTLPALSKHRSWKWKIILLFYTLFAATCSLGFPLWVLWVTDMATETIMTALLWGILVGVVCDALFIAITRKVVRWSAGLDSFHKIAALLLLNCCFAGALIVLPIIWVIKFVNLHPLHSSSIWQQIARVTLFTSFSNLMILITAMIFFVLALAMLLHRVLWPTLERPIYALQRLGLAKRSKTLGSLGIILLGIGAGVMPSWLKTFLDSLIGY